MCNFIFMHILYSIDSLIDILSNLILGTFKFVHKHPTLSILHQQKYVIFITEMSIQSYYVWVSQFVVDFQLPGELGYHVVLQNC